MAPERRGGLEQSEVKRILDTARAAEAGLAGSTQAAVVDELEAQLESLRVAFDSALASGSAEDALRTLTALERFWRARSDVTEARTWFRRGLAEGHDVGPETRAKALASAARLAMAQQDTAGAATLLEEALALFRRLGDEREEAVALLELGFVALVRGELETAALYSEQARLFARRIGDTRILSGALSNLGDVHSLQGEHDRALELYGEAVELRRGLGDPLLVLDSTYNLGVTTFRAGQSIRARELFEETLASARELGQMLYVAAALFLLAVLDLLEGDPRGARPRIRESLVIYTQLESTRDRGECLVVFAGVAAAEGELDDAARLFGAGELLRGDAPVSPFERPVLERFEPLVRDALGDEAFSVLAADGARVADDLLRALVAGASDEARAPTSS